MKENEKIQGLRDIIIIEGLHTYHPELIGNSCDMAKFVVFFDKLQKRFNTAEEALEFMYEIKEAPVSDKTIEILTPFIQWLFTDARTDLMYLTQINNLPTS